MDRWTKLLYCIALLFVCSFSTDFGTVIIIDDNTETPVKVTSDSALSVTLGSDTLNVRIGDTLTASIGDTVVVKIQSTDTVKIWDGTNIFKTDGATNAIQSISYPHHEIHSGSHFFIQSWEELDNNDTLSFGTFTHDTTRWKHMLFLLDCTGRIEFEIYEGSIFDTTSGIGFDPVNNNRNSTKASTLLVRHNPNFTSAGTLLGKTNIGFALNNNPRSAIGNKSGRDGELVLKQNEYYRWHFVSDNNDNYVSFLAEFYEHINK